MKAPSADSHQCRARTDPAEVECGVLQVTLLLRPIASLPPRPGACSDTNRVDQTGQTDRVVEVRRCPGRVPDVLTELRVHFGDVHGLERKIRLLPAPPAE